MTDDNRNKNKPGGIGRVIKLGLLLVVVVGVAGVGYGLSLPSTYHFERSVVIKGDTSDVHKLVGDLKEWDNWGPWRAEDPSMKYTYSESTTKAGDKMSWKGDKGSGSLTFNSVDEDKGVEYTFQWEDWTPNPGAITYEDAGDGNVKVTWSMESDTGNNILLRYFMTFGSKQMTDMFDKGLGKLKTKVEGS